MTRREFLVRLAALVAAPAALVAGRQGRMACDMTYDELVTAARLRTLDSLGRGGYFTADEIARICLAELQTERIGRRYPRPPSRSLYEAQQQRKARRA